MEPKWPFSKHFCSEKPCAYDIFCPCTYVHWKASFKKTDHFAAWRVTLTPAPTPEPGFGQGHSERLLIESVAKSRRSMISNERSWAFAHNSAKWASAEVVAWGVRCSTVPLLAATAAWASTSVPPLRCASLCLGYFHVAIQWSLLCPLLYRTPWQHFVIRSLKHSRWR